MADMDFDDRYPAMFQAGGDRLPAVKTAPAVSSPASPLPLDAVPENLGSLPESVHGTTKVEEAGNSGPANGRQLWSLRALLARGAVAMLCLAAGVFALTATSWIPAARMARPEDHLGMTVVPWGWLIFSAAAPLIVAGLGMVVALLFLGTLNRPNIVGRLRAGIAALAAGALALALLGLFFDTLFPDRVSMSIDPDGSHWPIPWQYFLDEARPALAVLGLAGLAALAVFRPARVEAGEVWADRVPSGTTPSAKAALGVGVVFLGGAAIALFAQWMFPLSMAIETVVQGDYTTQSTPWPQRLIPLAGPLTMVGAATLFWGALIMGSSRQRPRKLASNGGEPDSIARDGQGQAELHGQAGI